MQIEDAVHNALRTMSGVERRTIAMALIDPIALFLMAATSKRCLTVSEMAPMLELPPASCYKIISQLEKHGLVAYCGMGRNGRSRAAAYTSVLREMNLEVKNSTIILRVTWKNGLTEEFRKEMNPSIAEPGTYTDAAKVATPVSTYEQA